MTDQKVESFIGFIYDGEHYVPSFCEFKNIKNSIVLFRTFVKSNTALFRALKSIVPNNFGNEVMQHVFRALTNPPIPSPILKRDIHTYETKSTHQNFLTEIYFGYHGLGQSIGFNKTRKHLIEFFKKMANEHINLDVLFAMRWYDFEKLLKLSDSQSKVVDFYVSFLNFITCYCEILSAYLQSIMNNSDFLKEFIRIWQEYSWSIIELHHLFDGFSEKLNEFFKDSPGEYNFNRFEIWRFLIKIFYTKVYEKCAKRLIISYIEVFVDFQNEKYTDIVSKGMLCFEDLSLHEYNVFYHMFDVDETKNTPKNDVINAIVDAIFIKLSSSTLHETKVFIR